MAAVKNFELTVNVEQVRLRLLAPFLKSTFFSSYSVNLLFFAANLLSNKADYEAQKVASNLTIQHTVSAALDGVPP